MAANPDTDQIATGRLAVGPMAHSAEAILSERRQVSVVTLMLANRGVFWGGMLLVAMAAMALMAPLLTGDPTALSPIMRLQAPSSEAWFGTDQLGRDVYARVLWGARISLVVGLTVAVLAVTIGLVFGMFAGYVRALDAVIMRVMDGLMAIPGILLAIALVSLSGATLWTVIIAIFSPRSRRMRRSESFRRSVPSSRISPATGLSSRLGWRPITV